MTAKEMFKKLGYQKTEEDGIIHYEKYERPCYREICFIHKGQLIDGEIFNNETKRIEKVKNKKKRIEILSQTPDEIKAIYKQMEELGWE